MIPALQINTLSFAHFEFSSALAAPPLRQSPGPPRLKAAPPLAFPSQSKKSRQATGAAPVVVQEHEERGLDRSSCGGSGRLSLQPGGHPDFPFLSFRSTASLSILRPLVQATTPSDYLGYLSSLLNLVSWPSGPG